MPEIIFIREVLLMQEMASPFSKNDFEFVSCNLCGADAAKEVMRIDGFHIVECKKCSLKYVNPRLKPGVLHKIYNENYYQNPAFKGKQTVFFGYGEYIKDEDDIKATFARRLKVIEKHGKKGKLLDIGCAVGFFLETAKQSGWRAQGLELSAFACEYAKKRGNSVLNKTLKEASFKSSSFDAVTLFDVIEHLPDPKSELSEVHRVLKTGGIFSITTPDIGSLVARMLGKNWEEVRRVREHIYFFSRETLTMMLESIGFEVLHIETAGRYFSVTSAIERGKLYNKPIFSGLDLFAKTFGLKGKKVYVDPRYKMTVYARKL